MSHASEYNGQGDPRVGENVTKAHPCPACKRADWCRISSDGSLCCCRREARGAAEEKQDANGSTYYVHRFRPRPPCADFWPPPVYSVADGKGERAEAAVLYQVYKAFLAELRLSNQHAKALQGRGLDPKKLMQIGYRTHGKSRRAAQALIKQGMEKYFPNVPGFFVQIRNDKKYWTVGGSSGLSIPVRDAEKRIVARSFAPTWPATAGSTTG